MKTAIIYWSSTGNTEAMAQAVAQGVESVGAEAVLLTPDQVDPAAEFVISTSESLFLS